jgi:hypothetical protein
VITAAPARRPPARPEPEAPALRELKYFVGVPEPSWLNACDGVPKFVSAARFDRYRSDRHVWPVTTTDPYAIDSGAYSALTGRNRDMPWWQPPEIYASKILTFAENSGRPPLFCFGQDLPCEPQARRRTGQTVREHQRATLDNYLFLAREWPCLPWAVVLQGWEPADYRVHEHMYLDAGVDLRRVPRVAIGSICRRAHLPQIVAVVEQFAGAGYRLHGLGVKLTALPIIGRYLWGADSMAWSSSARWGRIRLPECVHRGDCRNCYRYATAWRRHVLSGLPAPGGR